MTVTSAGHEGHEHLVLHGHRDASRPRCSRLGDPHTVARRNKADGSHGGGLRRGSDYTGGLCGRGCQHSGDFRRTRHACRRKGGDARSLRRSPRRHARDVNGSAEYTVNVALIADGRPVLGVVAAPAQGVLWRGRVGHGAERIPATAPSLRRVSLALARGGAQVRSDKPDGAGVALASGCPDDRFSHPFSGCSDASPLRLSAKNLAASPKARRTSSKGLALMICWDVAAGHAVLAAAGGDVTQPDGRPLAYDAASGTLIPAFVAWGDCTLMGAWAT